MLIAHDHYDARNIRLLAEDVLARWRRLVGLTEERNKLLSAAVTYYKTLNHGVSASIPDTFHYNCSQVLPVLENLESDYSQQGRDWCSQFSAQPRSEHALYACDKASFVSELLSKHMDNKERFMKVSIL